MKTHYLVCTSLGCSKTFRNEESLNEHLVNDHSKNETDSIIGYRCKKCKKILGTKQCLKEHMYTHTGQKPYRCTETGCGKAFRQSSQLSYHKKIHSELKNYLKNHQKEEIQVDIGKGQAKFSENITTRIEDLMEELPLITSPQYHVKLPNLFS